MVSPSIFRHPPSPKNVSFQVVQPSSGVLMRTTGWRPAGGGASGATLRPGCVCTMSHMPCMYVFLRRMYVYLNTYIVRISKYIYCLYSAIYTYSVYNVRILSPFLYVNPHFDIRHISVYMRTVCHVTSQQLQHPCVRCWVSSMSQGSGRPRPFFPPVGVTPSISWAMKNGMFIWEYDDQT